MRVVDKLDNYLGLPLLVGKKKSMTFQSITNRISCKINSWSKRLLSCRGKEIFIKSILQSIPTYAFSVFLAPRGIIEDLQFKINRMWWNGKDRGQSWSMLTWDRVCFPEGMNGLGFRDLLLFNLALLGRQVWRLLTCKDTLCYHVLSSKYFPDGDIFRPKCIDKPTWALALIDSSGKQSES
ncbi:hypothetical protein V6Z11_D03G058400 [Gossypium hirsutum]